MKRLGIGLLWGLAGFVAAALLGYFGVLQFSSNTHDRAVEAAMTSVFFFGPLGALVAFVAGLLRGGRTKPPGPGA